MKTPTFEAWRQMLLAYTVYQSVVAMVMLLTDLPQCRGLKTAMPLTHAPAGQLAQLC